MRAKLQTAAGHAVYALRKAIVQPVFGQIKALRGFRRFPCQGLGKVQAEWQRICLPHNLLKLSRRGGAPRRREGSVQEGFARAGPRSRLSPGTSEWPVSITAITPAGS